MNLHLLLRPLLCLVLVITVTAPPKLVLSDDSRYEACAPRKCSADTAQISYPFRISDGHPSYCGEPGFEIACVDNRSILSISGKNFTAEDIFYSSNSLLLVDEVVYEGSCGVPLSNVSLDRTPFDVAPRNYDLYFFYNCTSQPGWYSHPVTCATDPSFHSFAYFYNELASFMNYSGNYTCQSVIRAPVDDRANVSIWTTISAIDIVKMGFLVYWKAKDCSECEGSGGRCGFDNNVFVCFCPDGAHRKTCRNGKKTLLVKLTIGIAVGGALTVPIILGFCSWMKRKTNAKEDSENSGETKLLHLGKGGDASKNGFQAEKPVNPQDSLLMRLNLVRMATNNFSDENKLGRGGFGTVYKGVLPDGREIAVKRLSRNSGQGIVELKNEVTLIARLQHRNLVRLLGCSLEEREKLLIYEYMPNKSIDFFLFDPRMSGSLDWKKRFGIINGVARGLLYLHEDSRLRIIHRDLKTSNILLDHGMNPKISYFGMARIFGVDQDEGSTNRIVGTYGYMAPEYAMGGHFSVKSDVYSFGVLLLEIVSGRKNNSFHLHEQGERSLLDFTWKLWNVGRALDLIDSSIRESCDAIQALKCVHIGLLCVQEDPADRPTMSLVIHMLGSESTMLPRPSRPAFSICRPLDTKLEGEQLKKDPSTVNEVTLSSISPR